LRRLACLYGAFGAVQTPQVRYRFHFESHIDGASHDAKALDADTCRKRFLIFQAIDRLVHHHAARLGLSEPMSLKHSDLEYNQLAYYNSIYDSVRTSNKRLAKTPLFFGIWHDLNGSTCPNLVRRIVFRFVYGLLWIIPPPLDRHILARWESIRSARLRRKFLRTTG
jgi:hypothetical protein